MPEMAKRVKARKRRILPSRVRIVTARYPNPSQNIASFATFIIIQVIFNGIVTNGRALWSTTTCVPGAQSILMMEMW